MSRFTAANYALVLLAVLVHHPFGKRLRLEGVITRSLAGLSLSALVVASLANVCAGLIRPSILLFLIGGGTLAIYDWRRAAPAGQPRNALILLPLVLVAIGLFLLNDPQTVFLQTSGEGGKTFLRFNRHYSYFSSLSTEMLNAGYMGRLRIANLYPQPWSAYHFFNASTLAVAQGFLPRPGLFSYFTAQTCIMILILLSFGEQMLLTFTPSGKTFLVYCAWLAVGFSVFHHSLTWNLGTSGAFSVFAMVHLLLSLHSARLPHAAFFSLILGASAIRLAPLGALSLTGIAFIYLKWRQENIAASVGRLSWQAWSLGFLFCAYNALTVTAGRRVSAFVSAHWASGVFNDEWLAPLASYKILGFLTSLFFGGAVLHDFNIHEDFTRVLSVPLLPPLFAAFLGLIFVLLAREGNRSLHTEVGRVRRPDIFLMGGALAAYFLLIFRMDRGVFLLNAVAVPYFLCGGVLAAKAFTPNPPRHANASDDIVLFLSLLFGGTLVYLYTGTAEGIKGPAAMAIYDIGLWGVLGLFAQSSCSNNLRWISGLFLAHLMFFDVHASGTLRTAQSEHHDSLVDVTPLFSERFDRADYVGSDNMARFRYEDPGLDDVYSSVLGANLSFDPRHQSFMNWRFLPTPGGPPSR